MKVKISILFHENTQNLDQKVNQPENTVCLEQQIYASTENFTPTLLVVLETFRRSAHTSKVYLDCVYQNLFNLSWSDFIET